MHYYVLIVTAAKFSNHHSQIKPSWPAPLVRKARCAHISSYSQYECSNRNQRARLQRIRARSFVHFRVCTETVSVFHDFPGLANTTFQGFPGLKNVFSRPVSTSSGVSDKSTGKFEIWCNCRPEKSYKSAK